MRTWQKLTVAMLAAAALTGCGKNPAATGEGERVIKKTAGISRTAGVAQPGSTKSSQTVTAPTKGTAPAKTPGVSTKPGSVPATPTKPGVTAPTPTGQTGTQTPATGAGALRLTIRTWGGDPVGSLVLSVFSQVDPSQSAEIPLQLTGPEAQWEQSDVPAGRYTIRVKALGTTGATMGVATTEAIVEGQAMTDLTIDLEVETPQATPKPTSGATGGEVDPTPAPTATPSPAPSTAPTGPGAGGTLGLRVEIL